MGVIAFADESGDHKLTSIDMSFPNFCLTFTLFDSEKYVNAVVPALARLKITHFGHEGVVLHSTDIRKQRGEFAVLRNQARNTAFMEDLTALMDELPYELVAVVIRRDRLVRRYVCATNPYELSLEYALERALEWARSRGEGRLTIVAESRGGREDDQLARTFANVRANGNRYFTPDDFAAVDMPLHFVKKERNCAGHQIADLVAYACARHHVDPVRRPYEPYRVIASHFFVGRGSPFNPYGLKVFPT